MYLLHLGTVLLCALSFSTISVASRFAIGGGISYVVTALIRGLVPVLIVGAYAAAKRPKDLAFTLREVPELLFYGVTGMVVMYTAANIALVRLPISIALLLFYSTPLWVIIGGRLLHLESLTRIRAVALVLGFGGICVATGGIGEFRLDLLGVVAALAAGISNAAYMLGGRYGLGKKSPFRLYLHTFIWGSLILGPYTVLTGEFGAALSASASGWVAACYLGIVPSLLGNALLIAGLQKLESSTVSIVVMSEILFASCWGWLFFSEIPSRHTLLGGLCLICAILLVIWEGRRTPQSV